MLQICANVADMATFAALVASRRPRKVAEMANLVDFCDFCRFLRNFPKDGFADFQPFFGRKTKVFAENHFFGPKITFFRGFRRK